MRLSSRLALGTLLLSAPLLGHAQTAEPVAAPRFYVGLGAYRSYYQPFVSRRAGITGFPVPVQLTVGYQLRPRLALQAGLAYLGSTYAYRDAGYAFSADRYSYFDYTGSSTLRSFSASALARYTLTRDPARRLQFDAVGGLTLTHYRGSDQGSRADSLGGTRNVSSYTSCASNTNLLLTAGLGTRYRLSSRFDLTLDVLLNRSALGDAYSPPSKLGISSSTALGLRYRFRK